MIPRIRHDGAGRCPLWIVLLAAIATGWAAPAFAQPKGKSKPAAKDESSKPGPSAGASDEPTRGDEAERGQKRGKETVFDFSALSLEGSVRMPQLLYFLDRAQQELERASLERRSFIPELMKSLDEESL